MIEARATRSRTAPARARAMAALRRHVTSPTAHDDGMIAASLLAVGESGASRIGQILHSYFNREPHYGRDNPFRYRWSISTFGEAGDPTYFIGPHNKWWRPAETELREKHRRGYARRLALPFVLATQLELWTRVAEADGPHSADASRLLAESVPRIEDDLAAAIKAADPWADTLMLWQLTHRPRAMRSVRGLLFALAIRYGAVAARNGGIVRGIRHPFHATPLVSATAHLALGLWRFGLHSRQLPDQLAFVRFSEQHGRWADGDQPPDILTTLSAAELLLRLDPSFDPEPAIAYFESTQEPGGWWRALDPEVPALTAAIADWMARTDAPFAARFHWPEVALWQRDYITGLPTMAFFAGLADALASIGGSLGSAEVDAAFCDLAGFGLFNNRYGQAAGDDALRAFADSLAGTGHLIVRIGGDEILVLGRPTDRGALEPALRDFLDRWPSELASRLGVPPGSVRPRIVLDRGRAGALRELHAGLGRVVGEVKHASTDLPEHGLLLWR